VAVRSRSLPEIACPAVQALPITPHEHLQSTAGDYAEKEGRRESNRHKTANHIFHSSTATILRMGAHAVFQNLLAF
jgi:hypothetical protein